MAKGWLWSADTGGCGWFRTVIVAEALRKLGHDIGQGTTFEKEYEDAEALVGQRVCNAGSTTVWAQLNYQGDRVTVFDADDDYFHMYQHPEFGQASVEYSIPRIQARLLANAASSTWTTCASERLAQVFRSFCDNVRVVPNGLPERYLERPGPWERLGRRPIVGWAGSSFTQWELTADVKEALLGVGDWGGQLHTVGVSHPEMRRIGLAQPGVSVTGWTPGSEAYLDRIDFDVWVAPYRRTDYNEAKAPTKALEAAFLGIPIVASSTTPYREFVQDGVTGFLVDPGDDWEIYIRALIEDRTMRERMGRAAREMAREYTVENLAQKHWEPILFGGAK